MDELQNKVLKQAYRGYLDGKRAEIPFHQISTDLSTARSTIADLETAGFINVKFLAIGYADFTLTDSGVEYCAEKFS